MSKNDDSLLRDLTSLIPGYGGYRESESRREDDRLTREFLVKRIDECKNAFDALGSEAVAAGDLESPLTIEKIRGRVSHAQSRLAAAVEGYAGWFNERKVDSKLLEDVAKLDSNLVSLVDQIEHFAKDRSSALDSRLASIAEAADLLHARIDRRHDLLRAGSYPPGRRLFALSLQNTL